MGHLISSLTKEGDNASVNSTCAQPPPPTPPPPPPGHFGAFARHVSPGGGAGCKFCTARDHSQAGCKWNGLMHNDFHFCNVKIDNFATCIKYLTDPF